MVLMQTRSRVYSMLRRYVCVLKQRDGGDLRLQRVLPVLDERRFFQTSGRASEAEKPARALVIYSFENVNKKEKDTFLDVLHMYESQEPARRGHVDFINAAMNYMDEFGVNEDLEVYKKLIDVMPKGKFISTSPMAADFMYFPKQQQCIVNLLEKMENNGVIPDIETQQMLLNIFGQFGIPLRKFWRMMYWMPKFRHLNPWPTPRPVPTDSLILARLAIEKIASVDVQSLITVYQTEDVADSIDKTWVVSASSPEQADLLRRHPENVAIHVEGPFKIWVAHMPVDYFILRGDAHAPPDYGDVDEDDVSNLDITFFDCPVRDLAMKRSVHEQDDATIFSVCATGTSSKDSLLSWIRCLQRENPALEKIPVLFKLSKHIADVGEIEAGDVDAADAAQPERKIGDSVDAAKPVHKIGDN